MIKVEHLSFGFPNVELYNDVSFSLEYGQHCAFIGSNGTGKTTLIEIILNPDKFMYDGKITKDENWRVGYVNQFDKADKERKLTVFEYLSREFEENRAMQDEICAQMADAEDIEPLLERYQELLDEFAAMDWDNYESNIRRQLKLAGLDRHENLEISALSGGEYKLLQVIKEMLNQPELLVMDEPDVFLDFENLNGLVGIINAYKGTILAITHNRYLLHHCFNKILHLEDTDVQEFDGNYISYNFALLLRKIELQEQAAKEEAIIERTRELVERLRDDATEVDSATRGRFLHGKVSLLARLEARRIKAPFVDIRQPVVHLPGVEPAAELVEAANMRKHEVMRANLMKCPDGMEALKVTRAYHEKLDAMKKLEEKYGQTDDRVALARIELVALKEAVQVANDRYKAWKDAHPGETVDPLADKLYCDLIARSRFYRD